MNLHSKCIHNTKGVQPLPVSPPGFPLGVRLLQTAHHVSSNSGLKNQNLQLLASGTAVYLSDNLVQPEETAPGKPSGSTGYFIIR